LKRNLRGAKFLKTNRLAYPPKGNPKRKKQQEKPPQGNNRNKTPKEKTKTKPKPQKNPPKPRKDPPPRKKNRGTKEKKKKKKPAQNDDREIMEKNTTKADSVRPRGRDHCLGGKLLTSRKEVETTKTARRGWDIREESAIPIEAKNSANSSRSGITFFVEEERILGRQSGPKTIERRGGKRVQKQETLRFKGNQ